MDQEFRESNSSRDLETVITIEEDVACSSSSIKVERNKLDIIVETQRACRICHLGSKESSIISAELIELGCRCKGELGFAHPQCAEAWFKAKGNRLCEICGDAARNVSSVCSSRFMEEWNEGRWNDGGNSNSTEDGSRRRCFQKQPFCNLLMACLVIAFIFPWFFHINLL